MRVTVTFEGIIVSDSSDDDLEAHLDAVMEELLRLAAADPAVAAQLSTRDVEVSVLVEAATLDEATAAGSTTIRSAIHGAGGGTAGWDIDWCYSRTQQELAGAN